MPPLPTEFFICVIGGSLKEMIRAHAGCAADHATAAWWGQPGWLGRREILGD